MNLEYSKKLLFAADIFYGDEGDEDDHEVNFNDVWGWAVACGEIVTDDEMPELARLFFNYGWPGILYWGSQKNNAMRSDFYHYNRMIEFVENEEAIRNKYPKESARAYHKTKYVIRGKRNA